MRTMVRTRFPFPDTSARSLRLYDRGALGRKCFLAWSVFLGVFVRAMPEFTEGEL